MKTLEIDDSQEEVKCPKCSYVWWTSKVLRWTQSHKTIYCPECRTPLLPPAYDFSDQHKPKEMAS